MFVLPFLDLSTTNILSNVFGPVTGGILIRPDALFGSKKAAVAPVHG